MAELYVKPGNRQRGWNDPPQFSYGLQQRPPKGPRGPLARRPGAPGAESAEAADGGTPTPATPSTAAPPPGDPLLRLPPGPAGTPKASPPPPVGLPPPPPPPPPPSLPGPSLRADATKPLVSEAEEDCGVEEILSPLNEALDNCRKTVRKQVCDDIGKRLVILQQTWEQGKLSGPVRKGMGVLIQEFKSQNWDAADEIHRSLMVDHVTEVSQWMVGVKRLIAETRNLPTGDYEQKTETSLELEQSPVSQQYKTEPQLGDSFAH